MGWDGISRGLAAACSLGQATPSQGECVSEQTVVWCGVVVRSLGYEYKSRSYEQLNQSCSSSRLTMPLTITSFCRIDASHQPSRRTSTHHGDGKQRARRLHTLYLIARSHPYITAEGQRARQVASLPRLRSTCAHASPVALVQDRGCQPRLEHRGDDLYWQVYLLPIRRPISRQVEFLVS